MDELEKIIEEIERIIQEGFQAIKKIFVEYAKHFEKIFDLLKSEEIKRKHRNKRDYMRNQHIKPLFIDKRSRLHRCRNNC